MPSNNSLGFSHSAVCGMVCSSGFINWFLCCSNQHVISFPSAWRPFLAPHTARRPMPSSPSATLWACLTSRPSGSTRCPTTGIPIMSACTPTSRPSAEPSWTWCTSSSGGRSLSFMTTAQVQVQSVSVLTFQWCEWLCAMVMNVMSLLSCGENRKRCQVSAESFVTCQVDSEINGWLFCLSPPGSANVSVSGGWGKKKHLTQNDPVSFF